MSHCDNAQYCHSAQRGWELVGISHIYNTNIQVQSRISLIHRPGAPKKNSGQTIPLVTSQCSTQWKQVHKVILMYSQHFCTVLIIIISEQLSNALLRVRMRCAGRKEEQRVFNTDSGQKFYMLFLLSVQYSIFRSFLDHFYFIFFIICHICSELNRLTEEKNS